MNLNKFIHFSIFENADLQYFLGTNKLSKYLQEISK